MLDTKNMEQIVAVGTMTKEQANKAAKNFNDTQTMGCFAQAINSGDAFVLSILAHSPQASARAFNLASEIHTAVVGSKPNFNLLTI